MTQAYASKPDECCRRGSSRSVWSSSWGLTCGRSTSLNEASAGKEGGLWLALTAEECAAATGGFAARAANKIQGDRNKVGLQEKDHY